MTRFFAPLLAFAAAERTWQVLVGLGLLWLVSDLLSLFRTRGKAKAEEQSEEAG